MRSKGYSTWSVCLCVCLCVCVFVCQLYTQHLTTQVIVCATNQLNWPESYTSSRSHAVDYISAFVHVLLPQSSSGITSSCPRVAPTWSSLSQLLATVQPHLPPPSSSSSQSSGASAAVTITHSLTKLVSLRTS